MRLILGVGATSDASSDDVWVLISETLAQQGFSVDDVFAVATLVTKRDFLAPLCAEHRWELITHTAEELAAVPVPQPSGHAQQAVGTASVAEAAAMLHGTLVVGKTVGVKATVAVARHP